MIAQTIIDYDTGYIMEVELIPGVESDIDNNNISGMTRIYPSGMAELYTTHYTKMIKDDVGDATKNIVFYSIPTRHVYQLLNRNTEEGNLPQPSNDYKWVAGVLPFIVSDIFNKSMNSKDYQMKFGILYVPKVKKVTGRGGGGISSSLLSFKSSINPNTYNYVINGYVLSNEQPFNSKSDTISMNGICYYTYENTISQYDRIAIITDFNAKNLTVASNIQSALEGNNLVSVVSTTIKEIIKKINYKYYGDRPLRSSEETSTFLTSPFITNDPILKLVIMKDKLVQSIITGIDLNGICEINEITDYFYTVGAETKNIKFEYLSGESYLQQEPAAHIKIKDFEILYFLKRGVGVQNSLMQVISPLKNADLNKIFGNLTINTDGMIRYGNSIVPISKFLDIYSGGNANIYEPKNNVSVKNIDRKYVSKIIFPQGRNISLVMTNVTQKEELNETQSTFSTIGGGVSFQTYTNPIHKEVVEITTPTASNTRHINLGTVFGSILDLYTIGLNFKEVTECIITKTAVFEGIANEGIVRNLVDKEKGQPRKIIYDYIRQTTTVTQSEITG